MHKSKLACLVIDCPTDDVSDMAAFWGAALGGEIDTDDDKKYAEISIQGDMRVLVQAVDHPARVHLDIETDDQEAEVTRLEALGAVVKKHVKTWTIMEAPSGHRFCVIKAQSDTFDQNAKRWEGD